MILLDDAPVMNAVYFLHERSNTLEALKKYKALAENPSNESMQRLRSHQAGEHSSSSFFDFIHEQGIALEFSPPFASQSNGSPERLIQELWKMARTMLLDSRLDL